MRKYIFLLIASFSIILSFAQTKNFNLDLESNYYTQTLPDNWYTWGGPYTVCSDTITKHSGKYSIRIETDAVTGEEQLGSAYTAITLPSKGKTLELKAWVKYSKVIDGYLGLMMRIDGDAGALVFENMADKRISGSSDWVQLKMKIKYPEGAKLALVGAVLTGSGKLWIDDFTFLVDGKPLDKVKLLAAEKDQDFNGASNINEAELTAAQIDNLVVLAKVWGFLKYYHPKVQSGAYNWDYELFRKLPQFLEPISIEYRNKIILQWVNALGKIKPAKPNNTGLAEIKLEADLSWIDASLGIELQQKLLSIKGAKKSGNSYYLDQVVGVGNPVYNHENAYSGMFLPDAGYRLLALYRYWNIIQYTSPNRHLLNDNWTKVLKEYIPIMMGNMVDAEEYHMHILALITKIDDSHAIVYNDEIIESYFGFGAPPCEVKFIEGKLVVCRLLDTAKCQEVDIQIGDIIDSIKHTAVEDIVEERKSITAASNYSTKLRNIAENILRTSSDNCIVTVKRGNQTFQKQYPVQAIKEYKYYSPYALKDTCFKMLTGDIAYINIGYLSKSHLPDIMNEVMKSKGLVIDMRMYPNEFILYDLMYYLLPHKTEFVKFSFMDKANPGRFVFTRAIEAGDSNADYYKGKIVILVNEGTQSQGEFTTMALSTAPFATVLGSTTAGADGNISGFYLPGGIYTMISGIGVYYPDGTETQRVGIVPDYVVLPTIQGIIDGRDELLETALKIIEAR